MIFLTPATPSDLDFVLAAEAPAENSEFIVPWTGPQHLKAMEDPDCAHLLIRKRVDAERLGFLMLFGISSPHRSIEFRRIVVIRKGVGIGRATLKAVKHLAFVDMNAHRLWLDVKSRNSRARHLYKSEGFSEEGVMRECILDASGEFESLMLMSMLRNEYQDSLDRDRSVL